MAAFNASKISQCNNDGKSDILHLLFLKQEKWFKGETIEELNSNLKKLKLYFKFKSRVCSSRNKNPSTKVSSSYV